MFVTKDLEIALTSGGDERITLTEDKLNKYGVNPLEYKHLFTRGSCTCSPLNSESHQVLNKLLEEYKEENHDAYFDDMRSRLKNLVNYPNEDKFDVFFSPSGSDLTYYPLLFAKLIAPEKEIVNYVTCPEELGSGSNIALRGKIFAANSQFGEPVEKDSPIAEDLNLSYKLFPARDENGVIHDHRAELIENMNNDNGDEKTIIGNLVIGSKSGITDNITVIPRIKTASLWVVDICQFRTSRELINRLFDMGCMVMITGSKFYQSPPFCGALLVPKTVSNRLKPENLPHIEPFKKFFSSTDIPSSLPWLKKEFRTHKNLGMLLRWQAALSEMEKMNQLPIADVLETVDQWNDVVLNQFAIDNDVFEAMPHTDKSNASIISFMVKDRKGNYIQNGRLQDLYLKIVSTDVEGLSSGYTRVAIGQPVKYGDLSFIRLAIGSFNIRKLLREGVDFSNDLALLRHIKKLALEVEC